MTEHFYICLLIGCLLNPVSWALITGPVMGEDMAAQRGGVTHLRSRSEAAATSVLDVLSKDRRFWSEQGSPEQDGHRGLSEASFHGPGAVGASRQLAKSAPPSVPATARRAPVPGRRVRPPGQARAARGWRRAPVTPRSSALPAPLPQPALGPVGDFPELSLC